MDNRIKTTWVVVAHQAGARFMEHRSGHGRNLVLVRELPHPEGRLRNHEIDTDGPGAIATGGHGNNMRAMQREHSAHEHVVGKFAQSIASELSQARNDGAFESLILVAGPALLGELRGALDKQTLNLVVHSVAKNLASEQPNEVAQHIAEVLPL